MIYLISLIIISTSGMNIIVTNTNGSHVSLLDGQLEVHQASQIMFSSELPLEATR